MLGTLIDRHIRLFMKASELSEIDRKRAASKIPIYLFEHTNHISLNKGNFKITPHDEIIFRTDPLRIHLPLSDFLDFKQSGVYNWNNIADVYTPGLQYHDMRIANELSWRISIRQTTLIDPVQNYDDHIDLQLARDMATLYKNSVYKP